MYIRMECIYFGPSFGFAARTVFLLIVYTYTYVDPSPVDAFLALVLSIMYLWLRWVTGIPFSYIFCTTRFTL